MKRRPLCRLYQAASQFFYLQNQCYPRESALQWVGNRCDLTGTERELLQRGVFSQETALRRRAKRCAGSDWQQQLLVVDGHNVHITLESALLGRFLLIGNDGALRDLAGQSAAFKFSQVSEMAMDLLFSFLGEFRPNRILFLFDAPLSRSGHMAEQYRRRLRSLGLAGEARTAPVPEHEFPCREGVVASSDRAVLDASTAWLDLARWVIDFSLSWQAAADFTTLIPVNVLVHKEPGYHWS
ncbi:DUF434 domain-containing protein [Desulfoferrobacter suflitae]|uniref:DUF434 domain-containing protein n=1 Tax=Desulfoferrobacter suflitae TaxID=2865782 RepID=UPI0021645CFD|nr:DUF434 domain-containing protein [Desulfoferrobacter suflitae]MCK8600231.1 DUF434 domain-containing protein [Desulfoferrobacter suflitae]